MSDAKEFDTFKEKVNHNAIVLNKGGKVGVTLVYDEFLDAMNDQASKTHSPPNSALLRRIKSLSGPAKPGPGECDVFEWVSVATEILEIENSLTEKYPKYPDLLTLVQGVEQDRDEHP